jgi:hypothetical protein
MAVLLVDRAPPTSTGCKSPAALLDAVDTRPDHPLAERVDANRRELDLVRWLCTVRNKAIQHRGEEGYTGGRSIVTPVYFALLYATDHPTEDARDRAFDVYLQLSEKHGGFSIEPVRSREIVTYLDLAAHELLAGHPGDYDTARSTVAESRAFDIVVSSSVLRNADAGLARLIELAAPAPA